MTTILVADSLIDSIKSVAAASPLLTAFAVFIAGYLFTMILRGEGSQTRADGSRIVHKWLLGGATMLAALWIVVELFTPGK